ncbi:hypothetical protein [Streptomyces cupreus]|uniref:Uncharacterized protein n=1 Tax=Streptomyces cupreus TaxID=2759956 RepID=A0A7X1J7Z0_9ACTN|nr:hypothetical protein [Streptomyces cupreus]MBC2905374.1 hypothetical protein [Streptomyces cupreus]
MNLAQIIDTLGVDRETAERRARFFINYVEDVPLKEFPDWQGYAERADAFREAAQSAFLVDSKWAADLLRKAASEYRSSGVLYGWFLHRCTIKSGLSERDAEVASSLLMLMKEGSAPVTRSDIRDILVQAHLKSDVLRSPVQQAYFLMAILGSGWDPKESPIPLAQEYTDTLRRHFGQYPIGPRSAQISKYLMLAGMLADLSYNPGEASRNALFNELIPLAEAHAQGLYAARENRYQWRRMMSSIDLVDLDIACMVAVANDLIIRAHGIPIESQNSRPEEDPLRWLSIEAGAELYRYAQ